MACFDNLAKRLKIFCGSFGEGGMAGIMQQRSGEIDHIPVINQHVDRLSFLGQPHLLQK